MEKNKKNINNNIANFRKINHITVAELANMVGMTRQNLYKIENGERGMSLDLQKKLCQIFNCSVSDIYNEDKTTIFKKDISTIKFYNIADDIINNINYELIELPNKIFSIKIENNFISTKINNYYVIIDTLKKDIDNNKLYLINERNKVKIKTIKMTSPFEKTVIIECCKDVSLYDYSSYSIDIETAKNMIMGEIVFYGKSVL